MPDTCLCCRTLYREGQLDDRVIDIDIDAVADVFEGANSPPGSSSVGPYTTAAKGGAAGGTAGDGGGVTHPAIAAMIEAMRRNAGGVPPGLRGSSGGRGSSAGRRRMKVRTSAFTVTLG